MPRMITRYSRPEMRAIWTDENKLKLWLQIELLASEALVKEGVVPKKDFAKIKAGCDKWFADLPGLVARQKELEKTLKDAQAKEAKKGGDKGRPQLLRTMVGAEEIAEVVSRATGIPVSKLMQGERDKLLKMEDAIHQRMIDQEEAVRAVSNAVRRARSGLVHARDPAPGAAADRQVDLGGCGFRRSRPGIPR